MKAKITVEVDVKDKQEARQVQRAFAHMNSYFKGKGIIKMVQLFLEDAFIRNLVKMKVKKG